MGPREARPDDWLREPRRISGPKPSSFETAASRPPQDDGDGSECAASPACKNLAVTPCNYELYWTDLSAGRRLTTAWRVGTPWPDLRLSLLSACAQEAWRRQASR